MARLMLRLFDQRKVHAQHGGDFGMSLVEGAASTNSGAAVDDRYALGLAPLRT